MERKLARLEKIKWIKPIDGADSICLVGILGWQCVVAITAGHQVGDYVLYLEVDSLLPEDKKCFSFMEKSKYRVRTIKLRGQISQGLVINLGDLENSYSKEIVESIEKILLSGDDVSGYDLTEILGITKYEKPVPLNMKGLVKGNFPTHLFPKTDEERIQNIPEVFKEFSGVLMYATEKLEGTSASFYFLLEEDESGSLRERFGVCSRNLELKIEGNESNLYVKTGLEIAKEKLKKLHKLTGMSICVQGEIVGPGIEGNLMGLDKIRFYVYNMIRISNPRRLTYPQCLAVNKILGDDGFDLVPFYSLLYLDDYTMDGLIDEVSKFHWSIGNKSLGEGIVVRPYLDDIWVYNDSSSRPLSFKVKNNEYLLKNKE